MDTSSKEILANGRYQIKRVLGEGGAGKVYLALDVQYNRLVAVKRTQDKQKRNSEYVERMRREYYFLSAIDHPNVVKAYSFFEEDKKFFLVLEFVPGISLQDFIETRPQPDLFDQLGIAVQVCRAVEVINATGIIHRDLKPSNIMLDEDAGMVKLLDLGVGRFLQEENSPLTLKGALVGTPEYMSPEQIQSSVAANSDVFCLGTIFYQFFIFGKTSPFRGSNNHATLFQVATQQLPSLIEQVQLTQNRVLSKDEIAVYLELSELLETALHKSYKKRIARVSILAEELQKLYQRLKSPQQKLAPRPLAANSIAPTAVWTPTMHLKAEQMEKIQRLVDVYNQSSVVEQPEAREQKVERLAGVKARIEERRRAKRERREKKTISLQIAQNGIVAVLLLVCGALVSLLLWQTFKAEQSQVIYEKIENELAHHKSEEPDKDNSYPLLDKDSSYPQPKSPQDSREYSFDDAEESFARRDYTTALMAFSHLAEQKNPQAMYRLGEMYENGLGITADLVKAAIWYQKAAQAGIAEAMARLGRLYLLGKGVRKDYPNALFWLQKAVDKDVNNAKNDLGFMYTYGLGVTQDHGKARDLYLSAARRGSPEAMSNMGSIFNNGLGVEKDIDKAIEWYHKAALQGFPKAMHELANLHHRATDYPLALQWYQKAAQRGYLMAMISLADMYRGGRGVTKDAKQAIEWLSRAAQSGHPQAMNNLGFIYVEQQQNQLAVEWFRKAAAKNFAGGMNNLGLMYLNGKGVEKNQEEAVMWLRKAAQLGDKNAIKTLRRLGEDK